MPEVASLQVKCTVTGLALFHPFAFCAGIVAAVIVGLVLSSFTCTVTDLELSALSVAVPVTSWPTVSVETVWSGGQLFTPEPPASPQVKCTVTLLLNQPFVPSGLAGVVVAV